MQIDKILILKEFSSKKYFVNFLDCTYPKNWISQLVQLLILSNQSKQLDVIISDYSKAPILYEEADIRTIPVECVYSVIEVKAKLDKGELEKCYANMKSVRQLEKRAYYKKGGAVEDVYYMYGQEYIIPPVTYFIFAFDSIESNTLSDHINKTHSQEQLPVYSRIDSVCVLSKSIICNRTKKYV
jgi:hypothetical protein